MSFNQQHLYNELLYLRQRIKNRERKLHGRTPTVCTDAALYEMAELCPKKLADFEGVSGIGRIFIENYGEEFLAVILNQTETLTEKTVTMTSSAKNTLKELEKKLISINRRNRLLYMPKLTSKYSFDLYEIGAENISKLIYGKTSTITLADIENAFWDDFDREISKFKRIASLLREVNKDLRDKGQNDLYIGYPYVIGRVPGEDFDVRAPLVLFPVSVEKTATSIKVSIDETRDIIYNTTFILAYFKFNNITKPLPAEVIENVSESDFLDSIISFYSENDIHIKTNSSIKSSVSIDSIISAEGGTLTESNIPIENDESMNSSESIENGALKDNILNLVRFHEYKAKEFPHFNCGELYIESCAILGKFPICSSSIQKDFDEILKSEKINSLVNDLLLNSDELDYYSDNYNEEEFDINDLPFSVSEKNLVYINELNSSQEAVLSAIDVCDELVVQGPPGTGKSQVISNLISKFVSSEKTVLMVSEKKTALDVVYSRLGHLSQYALLIDDVGNKEAFYKQLSNMVLLGKSSTENVDLDTVSGNIDSIVERLEAIADKLYAPNDLGIEPYKLYIQNKKYDLTNLEEINRVNIISKARDINLLAVPYSELSRVYHLFKSFDLCGKIEKYTDILTDYKWISAVRGDMSEFETLAFSDRLMSLKQSIDEWKAKNFILRLFSKGKINQEIKQLLDDYFKDGLIENNIEKNGIKENHIKEITEFLMNSIDEVLGGISVYIVYQELKPLYDRLSDIEKIYIHSLLNIKNTLKVDYEQANFQLFNHIIYEHIGRFEVMNRALLQDIDGFDELIRSLGEAIEQKRNLSKYQLQLLLAEDMHNMTVSKRHGEILRILDSKRKWSVNKFIKKFDFEIFKSVKIWLLTPEVVSEIIPLQTGIFDLVVFDEASQMYVEKGIPSILRAKKVVIAGDHKQLRPSNLGAGRIDMDADELPEDEETVAALEEESLLDLARFKYQDVLLNFHYRSKYEELIAFSNYAFYKGRLYVSPNVEQPSAPPIEVHKMENAMWVNRSNIEEAKYIIEMLKKFFDERKEDETIGIITFNSNQRDLIDDLIDEEGAKNPQFAADIRFELARKKAGEDIGLFVKNIESVQGDERDVIIFSIGYAKNENAKLIRNFGWLNQKGGENRLNVAISRAKKKIHIVTSIEPSELKVEETKNDGPRILKKYLEYAYAVSSGDKETAKQILHSFVDEGLSNENVNFNSELESQVYSALTAQGYEVHTQIGIGGYSIDLAVKKNGKYILGIECDGAIYHNSKQARERDYHRQKYLESRGWKVHRIWSSNWWKNPQREIEKITNVIESFSKKVDIDKI